VPILVRNRSEEIKHSYNEVLTTNVDMNSRQHQQGIPERRIRSFGKIVKDYQRGHRGAHRVVAVHLQLLQKVSSTRVPTGPLGNFQSTNPRMQKTNS
jgi:hypothetical protein